MADPVHNDLDALVPDDSGSLAVDRRDLGQQITAVSAGTVDLPEIGPWISAAFGRVAAALEVRAAAAADRRCGAAAAVDDAAAAIADEAAGGAGRLAGHQAAAGAGAG